MRPSTLLSFLLPVLAVLGQAASAQTSAVPARNVYGFFTSWSVYARDYHIADVPAAALTHLVYMPANIESGRIALGDAYADTQRFYPGDSWAPGALRGSFRQMQLLKVQHPHLSTLISIGGAGNSQEFSAAVATAAARSSFVSSIVDFVVLYDFDGVDINWEYPGSGPNPADPANFTLLLQDLRAALDAKGAALSRTFELTIDVPPDRVRANKLEVAKIAPLVDAMHVMAFDYFVPQAVPGVTRTHHHAALFTSGGDPLPAPYSTEFHAAWSVDHYLASGVPAAKLHLGLGIYGRGYAGVSGGQNGLFAPYTGPMTVGTWSPAIFDYSDLVQNWVGMQGFVRHWDARARSPWLWNPVRGELISYEDRDSIEEKAWQIAARDLGGAMLWELSSDRSGRLVATLGEVFARPGLSTMASALSVGQPASVSLRLHGGNARAGRLYLLLCSLGDPRPGLPLPGDLLPLSFDPFFSLMLGQLGSPLFPGSIGLLDGSGVANAALRLDLLGSLPPGLAGQRLRIAAWVLSGGAGIDGEASAPLMLPFVTP